MEYTLPYVYVEVLERLLLLGYAPWMNHRREISYNSLCQISAASITHGKDSDLLFLWKEFFQDAFKVTFRSTYSSHHKWSTLVDIGHKSQLYHDFGPFYIRAITTGKLSEEEALINAMNILSQNIIKYGGAHFSCSQ